MTESSMFWDTNDTGDGPLAGYTEAQMNQLFRAFTQAATNLGGVFADFQNGLAVSGTSSPVSVATGAALAYGFAYFNTSTSTVAVATPASATRIDRIVLRVSWAAQTVRITRIAGAEGGAAPAMTQSAGTTWDIPLAQASITTGGVITVTDERDFINLVGTLGVTTAKLAADAVTGAKIADDQIDSEHYVDGSIDAAHLASDSVTTVKILDLNVTTGKIAADAITNAKIADDQIDSEHYVDGSIDTAHIGDLQVTGAKIAAATIDPATKLNGTNGIIANVSDGNSRGTDVADLQTKRSNVAMVASGNNSVVGGGEDNTASGAHSVVGGGYNSVANGQYSAIAGGTGNITSGQGSFAAGQNNTASGYGAVAFGKNALANKRNMMALGTDFVGSGGASQFVIAHVSNATTTNTPTELFADGESGSERLVIPTDTTWGFVAYVVARRSDANGESAFYKLEGCIDNNAGTTALVGTVTKTVVAEDTAAWDVSATADNTNDALVLTATGENAKTIGWYAVIHAIELTT